MKIFRHLVFFLLVSALICASALAEDDYATGLISDMKAAEALAPAVEAEIHRYDSVLYGGMLDHVTVNPNYGTDESGDFIALVYMNNDLCNSPAEDVHAIVTASNTVAYAVVQSCPGAVEMCVFWELPGYGSQAKIQFLIDGKDYRYGDAMLPKVMADAWG